MSLAHFQCSQVRELKCISTSNDVTSATAFASNGTSPEGIVGFDDFECCEMDIECSFVNYTIMYTDSSNTGENVVVDFDEIWQRRLREVQGAIISASLVELAIGMTGLVGIFLQLISPLAIAPVIALIGLSLFKPAVAMAGKNWTISGFTIFVVILFSQYLRNIKGKYCFWFKLFNFRLSSNAKVLNRRKEVYQSEISPFQSFSNFTWSHRN